MQVWVNGDDEANVAGLAKFLEGSVDAHKDVELKAFVVYLTPAASAERAAQTLTKIAEEQRAEKIGMTYLPNDHQATRQYKINLTDEVKNTVIIYRNKRVVAKFVNVKADEKGLAELATAIRGATAAN